MGSHHRRGLKESVGVALAVALGSMPAATAVSMARGAPVATAALAGPGAPVAPRAPAAPGEPAAVDAPLAAAPTARAVPLAAGAPAVADDGLRFESHAVYRLDPDADVVLVSVTVALTHEVPDPGDGSFYFFDEAWIGIPSEATDVTARGGDGSAAVVNVEPSEVPAWAEAHVGLMPVLRFGQTRTYTVDYTLPSIAPRSVGLTRVNDAVASFTVIAHGDPGLASVEVVLPTAFDSQVVGAAMDRRTVGDETIYTASAIADPSTWAAAVASRNEAALIEQRIDVGGHPVDVLAWPGDDAWTAFITGQLQAGLPALEGLIGLPWPAPADGLDLIESVTPDAHGFGGWYDSSRNAIEIGDQLDPALLFHELGHLWFNDELFDTRWILEGLAEEYSARVVAALGGEAPVPRPLRADAPGAGPLNEWGNPTVVRDEATAQREQFGYNAAWSVVHTIVDEIGTDAMARVLVAAHDEVLAYQGDPPPEPMPGAADWMWFLDLLEEVGGSAQASSMFASTVVTPEQLPTLEARAVARATYEQLQATGAGWTPPLVVRQAMTGWRFDEAASLSQVATEILTTRSEVATTVEPLGLTVPSTLEEAYETTPGDLAAVARAADEALDAAGDVVVADAAVDDERDVLETIGLLGTDIEAELDAAIEAFRDGDIAAASDQAQRVEQLTEDAAGTGRTRARAGAIVVGVAALVVALVIARSIRRRRIAR